MPNPKSGTVVPNLKVAIKEVETARSNQHQDVLFETNQKLQAKSGSLLEYRAEGEGDLKVSPERF